MKNTFNYSRYDFSHNWPRVIWADERVREILSPEIPTLDSMVQKIQAIDPKYRGKLSCCTLLEISMFFWPAEQRTCPESWGPSFQYTVRHPNEFLAKSLHEVWINPDFVCIFNK